MRDFVWRVFGVLICISRMHVPWVCVCVRCALLNQLQVTISNSKSTTRNRVLRKVFGPKRDEVTGEWRKLHEELICTPYPILCGW